ncbi:MAG: S-layer homology domain-containing protein [Clostridiales bacterium]|nr:S-layer homology domain-containing protein [Clostridiales bacterium]
MRKILNRMAMAIVIAALLVIPSGQIMADTEESSLLPLVFGSGKEYITKTDTGYMRFVSCDEGLFAEDYNKDKQILNRKKIKSELSYFEKFYSGKDYYYLVFGRNNLDEIDDYEVIRVVKYDKKWKRLGEAKISGKNDFGEQIRYPFHHGTTELAECNGELFLVTGHQGYVDPQFNMGHQGFLMFSIVIKDMSWDILAADLWHSFTQHIVVDENNDTYVLEESEGSRCTTLGKVVDSPDKYYRGTRTLSRIRVFDYGGKRTSSWAIATYATADDVETSSKNIIGIGASIDQSRYDDSNYKKTYNIYLTITPKNEFTAEKTVTKWLTSDKDNSAPSAIKMVKINNNKFLVLWERNGATDETRCLNYCFIDGAGNKLTKIYRQSKAHITSCEPILDGDKVTFTYTNAGSLNFYSIDTSSGKLTTKDYKLAGKTATWSFKDGVLTISGTGEVIDGFIGSVPNDIREKITSVVVEEGITSVGNRAFTSITNLTSIKLPGTLTKIGDACFYGCGNLTDVYIKPSVKSIPDDLTWTGWYWTSSRKPVLRRVTFHCKEGSYADKFAKEVGFDTVYPDLILADKTCGYNSEPRSIDPAGTVDVTGDITYKYYTDKDCKVQVTPGDNGSLKKGSAPSNVGTYYVKATITDPYWGKIKSNVAVLKIAKDPDTKSSMVLRYKYGQKLSANIVCGNTLLLKPQEKADWISFTSSDNNIATVDQDGNVKAIKSGKVIVTITSSAGKTVCDIQVLYKDVTDPDEFWYAPTNYLTDSGVVKGYDKQTKFKPANECTRAQMVTFIWRLQGSPKPKNSTCKFSDVKKTDYFYKAVIWGNENHIVEGYKDGTFGPQIVCARRHAVTFLWRLAGKPAPKTTKNKFSDVKKTDYFYEATLWASEKKILAGYSDGTFKPNGNCLRRQMVTFLYKYDKYINKK